MKFTFMFMAFLLTGCFGREIVREEQPTGTITAFGGQISKIPSGWRLCNGDPVPRTGIFANLYSTIGNTWGSGDGVNTFNLPDLRGLFLRGVDDTVSHRDPESKKRTDRNGINIIGAVIGSYQSDALQEHIHNFNGVPLTDGNNQPGSIDRGHVPYDNTFQVRGALQTSQTGNSSAETRSKNVYVYFIIKL